MATPPQKDQRLGVFIDIQNLYHSAKNLYGGRVNYLELMRQLSAAAAWSARLLMS